MTPLIKAQPAAPVSSVLDVQRRAQTGEHRHVPVNQLSRSPFQPRITVSKDDAFESLVESVSEYGVLQPVVVRELDTGTLELIAGERRLEAAKACGHSTIPARVLTNLSDFAAQCIALTENCARANLSTWEQAQSLGALKALCVTQQLDAGARALARMVGLSKSLVAELVLIAERLDAHVLAAVEENGAPLELERLTKATLQHAAKRDDPQARVFALTRALTNKEQVVVSAPYKLSGRIDKSLSIRIARPVASLRPGEATSLLEWLRPVITALELAQRK